MTATADAVAIGAVEGVAPTGDRRIAKATAVITVANLVSRLTGFVRVIAMGAALGATALGDTYQSANAVSNILFELLAGGMLSSVLVPTFVELIDDGRRQDARRLAGSITVRAGAVLGALVLVGALFGRWVMRALTVGVSSSAQQHAEVRLGAFLLWFFLPQLVLYAVGAVATALLNADRRFVAAAVAPVFNNVVVVATMIVFRAQRHGSVSLNLTLAQKLVLGVGTTAGVLVMIAVPLLALERAGLEPRARWKSDLPLRSLAARGGWAVGHLGLNELLGGATIVVAARVAGGVAAYQIAFTFFLLPHAVLSNPIFTTLYPRLSGDARAGRLDSFAGDLAMGLRFTAFVLAPAAFLLAALAGPSLTLVHLGALDANGARLVAAVLAAYAAGLLGYSGFFLLTRASYALDDVRGPTLVNLGVTAGAVIGMVVASSLAHGDGRVIVLGLVHAAATTLGSAVLLVRVVRRLHRPVPFVGALARDLAFAALAGGVAWGLVHALDHGTRSSAAVAAVSATGVATAVYLGGQWLARAPELIDALGRVRRSAA